MITTNKRARKAWKNAWLRSLAGLTINLTAAWFGLVIVVPNFNQLRTWADVGILIYDLTFGTIFLLLTVLLERKLQ